MKQGFLGLPTASQKKERSTILEWFIPHIYDDFRDGAVLGLPCD